MKITTTKQCKCGRDYEMEFMDEKFTCGECKQILNLPEDVERRFDEWWNREFLGMLQKRLDGVIMGGMSKSSIITNEIKQFLAKELAAKEEGVREERERIKKSMEHFGGQLDEELKQIDGIVYPYFRPLIAKKMDIIIDQLTNPSVKEV